MPASVSVLIVSFNTGEYLAHTLNNLVGDGAVGDDLSVEVVVFDNGSEDSTPLVLRRHEDKLIRLGDGRNYGYSPAVNAAFEASSGEYILLINGDVVANRDKLRQALDALPAEPCVMGIGQINEKGFPQLTWAPELRIGSESARRARTDRYRRGHGHFPEEPAPVPVGWVSGSAILARRDAWQKVGPWNEEYYLFFEDADWCNMARSRGVNVWFHPGVHLLHGHGRSMHTRPALAEAAYRYAQGIYWRRWGRPWERAFMRTYLAAKRLRWHLGGNRGREVLDVYAKLAARRPGEPLT